MVYHKVTHLHQVLIDDTYQLPNPMPEILLNRARQAKEVYPDAQYHLWCGEECREFISKYFDKDVVKSFDTLEPYAFKCDLARYCLLYQMGGIYFDLSICLQNPWNIPKSAHVAAFTQSYKNMELWVNTMQSLLWSLPRQREWELVIQAIVRHCHDRFYGPHDHYVTGPALVGYCFAQAQLEALGSARGEGQFMGEVRSLTPLERQKNEVFVAPNRVLVGTRDKIKPGHAGELGITRGNHYPEIWQAVKVYGEQTSIWSGGGPMLRVTSKGVQNDAGLSVVLGEAGRISYGPYVSLSEGRYMLCVYFAAETKLGKYFSIEIAAGDHHKIHQRLRRIFPILFEKKLIFKFNISQDLSDVEFRICVSRGFFGSITQLELKKID